MATIKDYAYYISGRYIAILSRTLQSVYDPYPVPSETYLTPDSDDTKGVMVEYTYSPTNVTSESDVIDVNERIALAIVDYVKYRMYEDAGDEGRARIYYNKFKARISRDVKDKQGSAPIHIPNGVHVLK